MEALSEIVERIFLACDYAVKSAVTIGRRSSRDKEFHVQDWFKHRLEGERVAFDEPARNSYPDFRLINQAVGFELKGLGYPGREANYDCNSQIPKGSHNGREVYYVFARYPSSPGDDDFPVLDLVVCHGSFLNADSSYVHKNKNVKGFGSYGDIMIRDRKMYVAPTPFALTLGTERQVTLIDVAARDYSERLQCVGTFERIETDQLVTAYRFDLLVNTIHADFAPNPAAGLTHRFHAYRCAGQPGQPVTLAI
jgi:hypothetical protein